MLPRLESTAAPPSSKEKREGNLGSEYFSDKMEIYSNLFSDIEDEKEEKSSGVKQIRGEKINVPLTNARMSGLT